ncbi:hypothetical protein H9660_14325 [Clostridium sp. Sa3CUN1]|uniref:Uncharacterized protein n=1 Tax=Clostridium gallinarum TaxID=2762246 RepID=A0ABR8Q7H0_9CLOT|nr:hypothetical protein [Clostridium gallinarum]MBD7916320.1 hypothetical protein [Clostridium gallinarum]
MKNIKEKNSEITLDFSMEKLEERLESIAVPFKNEIGTGGGCYGTIVFPPSPEWGSGTVCPLSSPVGAGTFAYTH